MRKLALFIFAATWVYTAALCGWQLNDSDDLFIIIPCLVMLLGETLMAYGILRERENQQ